ncbi:MAG: Xaa-Pro aminopeptidase, partial [Balneolaceae bacterium]
MKKITILILAGFSLFARPAVQAQMINSSVPAILDMRERAEVIDQWLEQRLETVVPELMRREGIDMWLLIAQEYNEDPVLLTMLPATWQSSRRTTILMFYDPGSDQPAERMAVARYNIGFFETKWIPDEEPDQWKRLSEIITELNPKKIGVNTSENFALADGISHTNFMKLKNSLSAEFQQRIVSAENLAIGWLETRTEHEMVVYRQINRIAHILIEEGLSDKVITPGVTTTDDLQWWWRDRIRELKLTAWFHPSVSIQRAEEEEGDFLTHFSNRLPDNIIQPGDLIHI